MAALDSYKKDTLLLCELLILAVFLAYANIYSNPFLYDDLSLIYNNEFLQSWSQLPKLFLTNIDAGAHFSTQYYRPLQSLLYLIIAQTAGLLSIGVFHLLNVSLHAANACLVFKLGQKLGFKTSATFIAALLWAVHPIHTEAVTYMSATADTLYSFFCLAGIIILLPDFAPRRVWLAMPLMLLGLLSKESAVSFPLLAASCLYFLDKDRFNPRIYFRLWPLIALAGLYIALHLSFLPFKATGGGEPAALSHNCAFCGSLSTLPHYVLFLLVPIHLHMGHDIPVYTGFWHASIGAGIFLFMLSSVQILRKDQKRSLPLGWGLFWLFAALLPTLGIPSPFYEHWLYLGSAGLFLGIAQSIALMFEKMPRTSLKPAQRAAGFLSLAAVFIYGFMTYQQNRIWREPVAFYRNIINQGESSPTAHGNLGILYGDSGDYGKAVEEEKAAIENSRQPRAEAELDLGIYLMKLPDGKARTQEALAHIQRALEINPDFYHALAYLASFYEEQGDQEKAAEYRNRAAEAQKQLMLLP